MSSKRENGQVILPCIFLMTHMMYLFIGNYIGQEITDHNNHIFVTAYNVKWYLASVHIQRMILFLLQRNMKAYTLHIGVFFVGSMEGAASLLSASLSYFTVLYSIQK